MMTVKTAPIIVIIPVVKTMTIKMTISRGCVAVVPITLMLMSLMTMVMIVTITIMMKMMMTMTTITITSASDGSRIQARGSTNP